MILGCPGTEQASKELTLLPGTEVRAELRKAIFNEVQHWLHLLWAFSDADTAGLSDRSLRSYEKQVVSNIASMVLTLMACAKKS